MKRFFIIWAWLLLFLFSVLYFYKHLALFGAYKVVNFPDKVYEGYVEKVYKIQDKESGKLRKICVVSSFNNMQKTVVFSCNYSQFSFVCTSDMYLLSKKSFWYNKFNIFLGANTIIGCSSISGASWFKKVLLDLLKYFARIKKELFFSLKYIVGADIAGLILGILFGTGDYLTSEISALFKSLGLIHVLVVSGYNITLVDNIVDKIVRNISVVPRTIIKLISLIVFVTLVGVSPPVLRAFFMWLIGELFMLLGFRTMVFARVYVATLMIIFLWDFHVVLSVSYLLSVVATLGVIYLAPLVYVPVKQKVIKEVIQTTTGAMLATAPILFIYFHTTLSIKQYIANIVLLPFIEVISTVGYVSLILLVVPVVGVYVFGVLNGILLSMFLFLANLLNH